MTQIYKNKIMGKLAFDEKRYFSMIDSKGLKNTWKYITGLLSKNGVQWFSDNIVDFYDIGRLYEMGLAYVNKEHKKKTGQYYTPKDVSQVMANYFVDKYKGGPICDVACGCGNLIIEVLSALQERKPDLYNKVIKNHLIYLYDSDELAMTICINKIVNKFDIEDTIIEKVCGDFLSDNVKLPKNCSIITNPPYAKVEKNILAKYDNQIAIQQSKDYYVGFLSKCISNSAMFVSVTPQSFLVGCKFSIIRKELSLNRNGEIYAFDNVPATLFNGKKEGIFNSNTSNGVRAAICCSLKSTSNFGYRVTPLIRFNSSERELVINNKYLNSKLGNVRQDLIKPLKCDKTLEKFVYEIINSNTLKLGDLFSSDDTKYPIYVSNSARYYISGAKTKLDRNGVYCLYAKSKTDWNLAYALLNSSYCYMWWRMLDGGILLPKSLLMNIEIPKTVYNRKEYYEQLVLEAAKSEKKYLHYKKNAGKDQETVKFPPEIRNKLNKALFPNMDETVFEILHSNKEI